MASSRNADETDLSRPTERDIGSGSQDRNDYDSTRPAYLLSPSPIEGGLLTPYNQPFQEIHGPGP